VLAPNSRPLTTSVAAFDGTTWAALGQPPLPKVTALTTWNGLLVAAGGTGNTHSVATWNGASWVTLGTTNGRNNTMAVFNGELFVGGLFSSVNGVLARSIARWNGAMWSEPGGGIVGEVRAMVVFGSRYVGGSNASAGPIGVSHLAIWNGSAWSWPGNFNSSVYALAARLGPTPGTSFLFAGGDFGVAPGVSAPRVAQFSASTGTWTALPGLPGSICRALHVRSTSLTFQLHAAVDDANSDHKVWRLNGTTWTSLGPVSDESEPLPRSLAFFNGQLTDATTAAPCRGRACVNCWCAIHCPSPVWSTPSTDRAANPIPRRAGCVNRARPDLWEPWTEVPGRPGGATSSRGNHAPPLRRFLGRCPGSPPCNPADYLSACNSTAAMAPAPTSTAA
jgi:hypothetical protein